MKKIGIVGFGFVGQALYTSLKNTKECVIYDKYKEGFSGFKDVFSCDFIFVCISSPMDKDNGDQDFTEINDFLSKLWKATYSGIVIVKSTVIFNNIEPWAERLNVVVNPEFLKQNTAVDDFLNQKMILLGGEATDCCDVKEIYLESFNIESLFFQFTTVYEACMFKYIHNTYHAYQVLFWNYVHEVTKNSRKYIQLYKELYGKEPIMSQVSKDGELGYGGACFPKDVNALRRIAPHLLTDFMCNYNKKLRPGVETK